MFISKIALALFAILFQYNQVPQQGIQTNINDKAKQYSVLEIAEISPAESLESNQVQSKPVAHVAQLPQDSSAIHSSRRKLGRMPMEPESIRPALDDQPRFQLQLSGADLVQAGNLQTFKIRLDNLWPSDSHSVQLQLGIPPGFEFADSDVLAKFDPNRNIVGWELKSVQANTGVEINFRARAIGQGPQLHQINLIQNRTVQSSQQLETFVLVGNQVAGQLPLQQLPSQAFPQHQKLRPMIAQELPPIVQSHQAFAQPARPARTLTPSQGPPLPIYRR